MLYICLKRNTKVHGEHSDSLQVCYQTGNFLAIVVNGIPLAKERTQCVNISVLLCLV